MIQLSGCGYRFADSRTLTIGVDALAVHVLENRTRQTGLEVLMTNALVDELTRHRQTVVVDDESAQAVLSGKILRLYTDVVSRTSTTQVSERRVTMEVLLNIKQNDGTMLWQSNVRASENYRVSTNRAETDRLRQVALGKAAQRIAEEAYINIGHGF